jgi:hypothetical protein
MRSARTAPGRFGFPGPFCVPIAVSLAASTDRRGVTRRSARVNLFKLSRLDLSSLFTSIVTENGRRAPFSTPQKIGNSLTEIGLRQARRLAPKLP